MPTDAVQPGQLRRHVEGPGRDRGSGNPLLSTLVTAVGQGRPRRHAEQRRGHHRVRADNDAFAKIPAATLNKVLADKAQLTKILTYHVVAGKLTPDQLAGTHKTLEGGT